MEAEIGGFQPNLVFHFSQGKVPSNLFLHDLTGGDMCCWDFFSYLFQGGEMVLYSWEKGFS